MTWPLVPTALSGLAQLQGLSSNGLSKLSRRRHQRRGTGGGCQESPFIARNLAGILSRHIRLANTHPRFLATLDVQGRVAAQLLAFASAYGEDMPDANSCIPLRLTQSDLAALVGAFSARPLDDGLGLHLFPTDHSTKAHIRRCRNRRSPTRGRSRQRYPSR